MREQKRLCAQLGRVMCDVARKIDTASQTDAIEGERVRNKFAGLAVGSRIHTQKSAR